MASSQLGQLRLGLGSLGAPATDPTLTLTGSSGIASAEAFGTGEVSGPIVGASGIASAEAFGSTGASVTGPVVGTSGIASAEAFGAGTIAAGITGTAGIASAEAFGADGAVGSVGGPIDGVTGIASAEAFGSTGASVTGPIIGDTGIASAEAFGTGAVFSLISGAAGIASEEAFGANGSLGPGLWGGVGIPSGEAFGVSGAVLQFTTASSNFAVYINNAVVVGVLAESIQVDRQLNFLTDCSFRVQDTGELSIDIGQDVVIYFYDETMTLAQHGFEKPGTDSWHRIFAGTVDSFSVSKIKIGDSERFISIKCAGYAKSLTRRLLNMKYPAAQYGTFERIMEDIQDRILTPEGIFWERQGTSAASLGDVEFSYVRLNDVLDQLTDSVGWEWQVDFYRRLLTYDRPAFVTSAPFDVTEDTSGANGEIWYDLDVVKTRGLYRNRQHTRVNFAQTTTTRTLTYTCPVNTASPPAEFYQFWDLIPAGAYMRAPFFVDWAYKGNILRILSIKLNGVDQPFFTQQIPGLQGGTPAPTGWKWMQVWERDSDLIYNMVPGTEATWPQAGDVLEIVVELQNDLPAPVVVENASEIAARASTEGNGTGIYEDVVDLPDTADADTITAYAQGLLDKFSVMGLDIQFSTRHFGLEPGQEILVDLPSYGVDNETMIVESLNYTEESGKRLLNHGVRVSNQVQQRDALAAFHRLIKRLRKPAKQEEIIIPFDIAKTIPGIINPGAVVGTSVGNAFVVRRKQIVLKDFALYFKTPPTGQDFSMDIKRNGVSILATPIVLTAGTSSVQIYSDFLTTPVILSQNDILTMDILSVGAIEPGKDGFGALRGYA